MNEKRVEAILKAGIIPGNILGELSRWQALPETPDVPLAETKEEVVDNIREVLESQELVELHATDLDAIKYYKENERRGRLYYVSETGPTFSDINYAKDQFGRYLIPWTSDSITELMLAENTYLKPRSEERVYFEHVHELYYGSKKAFMVCTPENPPRRGKA